ncbi:ATP-binding cassette domain-containing protein [Tunicatimonas pelagia]|uniref:ATP-binding cassette domain-containing protein n=1 Tax=Tunicatimonas pelagia TaxID=931531 RepID=UPI0026658005|nr:ATP-binding cassette domain-containing protein [Tunicatimonas pelagia]WKN44745.1 ATP-binding cassette domain-containing protein [Tunicatimonas pelagia]
MSELRADSIIKSFGIKQVLTDVFVSCKTGEIVGLLGRNGSGKSTLLKIIFGSLSADSKMVKVDHKIIRKVSDSHRYINYLPQDGYLPSHLKIANIINIVCEPTQAEIVKSHRLVVPLLNKTSKQLSGGERRVLEILLIVYSYSKFSLLDEPFNGIAPIYKDEIKDIIQEQSKEKGFIITDHDYRNVLDIATKVILIHDGGTRVMKDTNELAEWGYLPK